MFRAFENKIITYISKTRLDLECFGLMFNEHSQVRIPDKTTESKLSQWYLLCAFGVLAINMENIRLTGSCSSIFIHIHYI